jgi:CRISPR-associated endonuclease/helicase Cas3
VNFAEFFEAVWKRPPFPWQVRLAESVLGGNWPPSIGLPTAAGKTALIDVAVFALAMGAPRSARRIFFVVDRRVVVDEAAARAEELAGRLAAADPTSELGVLAQCLRDRSGSPDPLRNAVLRGGIPRDDSWTDSPLQAVVICSTVDQLGSSLLFRAYGSSEYARPVRAGLAACDSLLLLDEAHTSQPFAETLGWIGRYRRWAEQPLELPFTVVEISATPRGGEAFREQDEDCTHPVLHRRWGAEKRARLVLAPADGDLAQPLSREALAMSRDRGAKIIGVIANRVATARAAHGILQDAPDSDAILLTGRARPYDRDRIWQTWGPTIGLGRKDDPARPVFVVATQCIEVGANLDFDALVTEIASIDALEQRFGRLDRDGGRGVSHAAIVARKDQTATKYEDAIYGKALPATWRWLSDRIRQETRLELTVVDSKQKQKPKKIKDEFVPMGVLELRRALEQTADRHRLTMPRQSAPVLMPAHLDLLCQTSPEPALSPEPAVFLHGTETGPDDVQVVWRQDLAEDTNIWADIAAMCPPSAAEAISLPVWAVRQWLAREDAPDVADIEGLRSQTSNGASVQRPVLQWRTDESRVLEHLSEIRPGMTIVVPSAFGGCDEWGWNPGSDTEVADVGDQVKLRMGRPMLRLHPALVAHWRDPDLAGRLRAADSVAEARAALAEPLAENEVVWPNEAVKALRRSRVLKLVSSPTDDYSGWAAVVGKGTFDQASMGSSYSTEVPLDRHVAGSAEFAAAFARHLPEKLRNSVVRAAARHDIGKADPRFQAWLRGGNPLRPDVLIAKSQRSGRSLAAIERARRLAGYPKGGRHELLSVALLENRATEFEGLDFELLLHLVAAHHGRCRPFAPVVNDPDPVTVAYDGQSVSTRHGLERAGSGICDRFWNLTARYGWYGLAYLEALVRLADQRQSEIEQDQPEEYGNAAHA